jgi:hypothetical protein
MRYLLLLLLALPMISYAECDPDLSSGDECWTNCTTNDYITICDIIKLDTFWPESETQNSNTFQANSQSSALDKMFKTKTLKDGQVIKGRYISKRKTNIATNNGFSQAKDLKPNDKADLMVSTMGFIIAGGVVQWETQKTLVAPPSQTGVGSSNNLCRYTDAQFRPFNKGGIASGNFHIAIKRESTTVNTSIHSLEAQSGIPVNSGYYKFNLDLAQGWNNIEIKMDSNNKVDELSESNNAYKVKLYVDAQCGESLKFKKANSRIQKKSDVVELKRTDKGNIAKSDNKTKSSSVLSTISNSTSKEKKCKDPLKEGGWCV